MRKDAAMLVNAKRAIGKAKSSTPRLIV